ncbi:FUSC family protein [Micromonospora sp. NPDC048909]|uniref:FUSC family protein n=1 Tax=Micromonospora sp. NPDC048909 TaxID=3155643 RepID=UPI0034097321
MLGTSLLGRLRHRDPGYAALRRAARLTLVASSVFYACRYGAGDPLLATYALFGTVAAGMFAQLPGPAPQRARILVTTLPVAWALVAAGTLLAWNTWAAAGGMLVIGFAVAFGGVGGPRLVGLGSAFQLFYILASFPPFQPGTVPQRLGGVTLGIVLLAAAEVVLWPDPVPISYRQRLVDAADRVAAFLDATADALSESTGRRERDVRHDRATEAVARLELGRFPPTEAPTAADARDRALRIAGAALREVFVKADRLTSDVPPEPIPDLAAARLLRSCADTARAAGPGLLPGTQPVALGDLDAAIGLAEAAYPTSPEVRGEGPHVPRLCRDATALALADQVRVFAVATRVATRARPGDDDLGLFEYVRHGPWTLYSRQFRSHLTLRSANLHSALRLAVALAAARVVAGTLQLTHGFWVLLATLTVLRTSAADTRTALRPAVAGTIVGAVGSGLLMLLVDSQVVYAAGLPAIMLLAFGAGRLLGPAWAQAMFTVLLTFVFAQLAPEGWRLAEARLVDVLLGGVIGVLAGVAMWPHGASRDLRRNVARYLVNSGDAVEQTVEAVLGGGRPDRAVARVSRSMTLADASYCQYHAERHAPPGRDMDWESALNAGHHVVQGAESLLRRNPPGCLAGWPGAAAQLQSAAGQLRSAFHEVADDLAHRRTPTPPPVATSCADELDRIRPLLDEPGSRAELRHLVEVDLWLTDLADSLARIRPAPDGSDRPGRVSRSAAR